MDVQVCREFSWLILHWSAFHDGLIYEKTLFSHIILYTSDYTFSHTCNQLSTQLSRSSLHTHTHTHTHMFD